MKELDIGKLPPQAVELEEAVLGALLLQGDSINEIVDILTPESFYKDANVRIYTAIKSLFAQNKPIDMLTVVQELKRTGELEQSGGAYAITVLTNKIGGASNIEFHARIVQQKAIQRELIKLSTEIIKQSYSESADCFEILEFVEKGLTTINKVVSVGKVKSMHNLWSDFVLKNDIITTKKGISGIPSGYANIDSLTGGFQQPDLIIIAARPSMGKTALACNFGRNASVDYGKNGLIFSLEMSSLQIATRMFAIESGISIQECTRVGIPNDRMVYVSEDCDKLSNAGIWIDDTAGITLQEMRSKSRKFKREKNIQWIIIDYLQLMTGDKTVKGNREQEISTISRGIKQLAKELEIPIIALSQLSRAVETRGGDKRPILSDLRESGAIEQDADIVVFIHRPEYYGVTEYESGESTAGIAELIFSKHRNGALGTEKLKFINYLTKFTAMDAEVTDSNTFKPLQPNTNFNNDNPF